MRHRTFAGSLLALTAAGTLACAKPAPAAPAQQGGQLALQGLVDSLVAQHKDVPGAALHVEAPRLKISLTVVAGYSDPKTKAPLTPGSTFRMASNTKTYTAAAILRLWEQDKLGLDDPMSKHVPADLVKIVAAGKYHPDQMTIRHLLSHSSGLYDWGTDSAYGARVLAEPTHRWSRKEQVQWAMDHGARYGKPGEVYHYSDTGYILLGEIVERVSGMPLATAFRTLLNYEKLGLLNTWMETLEPIPPGTGERAHQYQGDLDSYGFDPSLDLWGGGGNDATVKDMARFTRSLFVGGVYDKKTTMDTMLTKVPAQGNKDYRFGIHGTVIDSVPAYGHTGYWNTFSYYYPDIDVAIAGAVTQNAQYPLARELNRAALGIIRRLKAP